MSKTIVFLTDGMADEPLAELDGKTPLEHAHTPYMDSIASKGASGTFLSLPDGFPTSSDVANMSVLGYDLATNYTGRGPLEACSQGIELAPDDVAFRCNLVEVNDDDILLDYSGGHIEHHDALTLIQALKDEFDCAEFTFHPGVSYRNLLIMHGRQFTDQVLYEKPDASQDMNIHGILLRPANDSKEAAHTAEFLNSLTLRTRSFLNAHPYNQGRPHPANMIFPWSPGKKPSMQPFASKYGRKGAIISAVDVIFGLGVCADMTIIKVPGATGFVDTNYEGKADAAVKALNEHDFVYLHVEAADECSHMGDLELKLRAITDIDKRLVGRVLEQIDDQDITFAVLPDHPVPLKQRIHTRTPVPVSVCGPHIAPDTIQTYSETLAPTGSLGHFTGDGLMKKIMNLD